MESGIYRRAKLVRFPKSGLDVIELGCGTAYVSAWLARRGAHVTGIDNSEEQPKTARPLQAEHGLPFSLIFGNAEKVPLPDATFDPAISEYGASIWCDPYRGLSNGIRRPEPPLTAFDMGSRKEPNRQVGPSLIRLKLSFGERFRALSQNPFLMIKEIGVRKGQTIADVGAGRGYLSVPAAIVVGSACSVYAVDPDPKATARIAARAASEKLENIHTLTTGAEDLRGIASDSVDLAFSVFSMHHFRERQTVSAEVRRVLKKGGTFYLWDSMPRSKAPRPGRGTTSSPRAPPLLSASRHFILGVIFNHGTTFEQAKGFSEGFASFEVLSLQGSIKARFTK